MGDFRAQIAAVKTGERRFLEMIRKYGRDAVVGGIEAIMDQSEAVTRARVSQIPDGVYEASSFMDDDGVKIGERVPIKVRVEIKGDRMKVDLTDVSKQVAGFYNSGETAGRSCCQVAFKCLTSALDLPINDGQFRALEIVLPPGRVVSALKPAAMRLWMTYPMTIIDTIFKALAPAIPEHVIAGHHADLVVGRINGRRPKDDSFYIYLGGLIGGGWGAKHDSDGRNSTIAMNDGDTHNGPSEQVEAKYPLLVERYALRPDSGGAGRFRGGLGCEQVVQARHDIRFNSQMDRVKCKPWGLEGGLSGLGNGVAISRFGKTEEQRFHNGKALNQVLHAGDAYVLRSGGGGGFGSPLDRDLAALERDVRCGYVSREAAERDYGAVFEPGTGKLDVAATRGAPRRDARAGSAARRADRRHRRAGARAGARACARPRAREAHRGGARRAGDDRKVLLVGWAYRPRNGSGCSSSIAWIAWRVVAGSSPCCATRSWQSADDRVDVLQHLEPLEVIVVVDAHAVADDLQQVHDPERIVALVRAQLAMVGVIDRDQRVDAGLLGGVELVSLQLAPIGRQRAEIVAHHADRGLRADRPARRPAPPAGYPRPPRPRP